MVFHPLDLVDPFAPNAVDTEYKPGVDMVYGQYLFENGSNLEAIAVPRAATYNATPTWEESTFALRYSAWFGDLGTVATLARDRGDTVIGLGLSGPLGDATWNVELMPTFVTGGGTRFSGLANISTGFMLGEHNATGFVEYFHNGFGVSGSGTPLDQLPADLTARVNRGQLFTDFPRLYCRRYECRGHTASDPFAECHRQSRRFQRQSGGAGQLVARRQYQSHSWRHIPLGGGGTEFGGRALTAGSTTYARPATTAYVQLRQYF